MIHGIFKFTNYRKLVFLYLSKLIRVMYITYINVKKYDDFIYLEKIKKNRKIFCYKNKINK
jgi:hypothetical protein